MNVTRLIDLSLARAALIALSLGTAWLSDWMSGNEIILCALLIAPPAIFCAWARLRADQIAPMASPAFAAEAFAIALLGIVAVALVWFRIYNAAGMSARALVPSLAGAETLAAAVLAKHLALRGPVEREGPAGAAAGAIGLERDEIRRRLQAALCEKFNHAECSALIRLLGHDPERIPAHNQNYELFALETVAYFERQDQLHDLWNAVRALRPRAGLDRPAALAD